jgi:hypothetical protein
MSEIAHYLSVEDAAAQLKKTAEEMGSTEIAAVRNLGFVPQLRDYYVLAPHTHLPLDNIYA